LAITTRVEKQQRQLKLKASTLERRNKEIKALKERIAELSEELEDKQSTLEHSQKNEVQYRNWWLNEIQFTKLLVNKIPNPNRDIELVRSSQAHYLGHY
jgi:predicted RNase H-like nuclease (RuvC/YqgF family)